MSFNPNVRNEGPQTSGRTAVAIKYLRQGWRAQAYLILSEPGQEKIPAAQFALGICHFHAGDLPSATMCIERALQLLRASSSPPAPVAAESSDSYIKLAMKQIEDQTYLTPMDADFCTTFPKAAEQTVILALIYVYLQRGMREQAQKLSSGLAGPVFEAHKRKLAGND
jgi:hypothetical protein